VIHLLRVAPRKERKALLSRGETVLLEHVVRLMERYGSLDYARGKAVSFVCQAKDDLDGLPGSGAKDSLRAICDFVVERDR